MGRRPQAVPFAGWQIHDPAHHGTLPDRRSVPQGFPCNPRVSFGLGHGLRPFDRVHYRQRPHPRPPLILPRPPPLPHPAWPLHKDIEFGEINLSALYQELTVEKMWLERTWFEVLKHFAITLTIGVLPTLFDMGTDINAVLEYLDEGDTIWGWTTFVIIFFLDSFSQFGFGKLSR